jgi:hypothetical protein
VGIKKLSPRINIHDVFARMMIEVLFMQEFLPVFNWLAGRRQALKR